MGGTTFPLIFARRGRAYKHVSGRIRGVWALHRLSSHQEEIAMLVLTRKTNESICIEGGIEVMVVQVRGNRVRLGFRAPAEISIQRKERMGSLAPEPHATGLRADARKTAAREPAPQVAHSR